MLKPRWVLSIVLAGVSALQAWDSHALQSTGLVRVAIAVGVLLPGLVVLVTGDPRLRGAAVVMAAVLFSVARYVSPVRLPDLTLAALFPAMLLLLDHGSGLRRTGARSSH